MTPDPSGAARAPQTTDELVAQVRGALARWKTAVSGKATYEEFNAAYRNIEEHAPGWLGAFVQAVEDQQRQIARLKTDLTPPTMEKWLELPVVETEAPIFTVKPGDRYKGTIEMRGLHTTIIAHVVRRAEFAWLEYQQFPETGKEICDHCGEEEPLPCRDVRGRHICYSCYLNAPVEAK